MTSEKRAQKFRTDDKSLPRSGECCWLVKANFPRGTTNQKNYQDLDSEASSVRNFCARFSDVIWRENQWRRRESRLFSQVMFVSPPKSCDNWRVVGLSPLPRSCRLKYLPFLRSVFLVASCWPQFVASYWMLVLSPVPVVNLSTAAEQRWCCFLVSCAMTFHHRRSANKTEKVTMSNIER